MKFEGISTNFFHNVINEEIPVKLFLQDKDLLLDKNAVVIIEADYLIVLSQNDWMTSGEDDEIISGGDFSIEISGVFLYF